MRHPTKLALIGFGKIAQDQHLPAIAADPNFELVCVVDLHAAPLVAVPTFRTLDDAVTAGTEIDAVILCTPPSVRVSIAERALRCGFDVMLEKPPAATLDEAEGLLKLAANTNQIAFATWHSRYAGMVAAAQDWLKPRTLKRAKIIWHEDVNKWHPGQSWLWQDGGLGVFDMGINALSILTALHPFSHEVIAAQLAVPENAETPAIAKLDLRSVAGAEIDVSMSFLSEDSETWSIDLTTDADETISLYDGGASMIDVNGKSQTTPNREYAHVYQRFAQLIDNRESDLDTRPLAIVEQALNIGTRSAVAPVDNG